MTELYDTSIKILTELRDPAITLAAVRYIFRRTAYYNYNAMEWVGLMAQHVVSRFKKQDKAERKQG